MSVLGIGVDVVDLDGFAQQLSDSASGFVDGTFTAAERRSAPTSEPERTRHFGVRFAAKEATLKAWSSARWGRPPALDAVDLREIEVVEDSFGRPGLRYTGEVAAAIAAMASDLDVLGLRFHVSLSHDGPVATAFVIVESA